MMKLVPLQVPWEIDDNDAKSKMKLVITENGTAKISFNAHILPTQTLKPFEWANLKRVTVTFNEVSWAKLSEPEHNMYTIDIPKYDWSDVFPPRLLNLLGPYHELKDFALYHEYYANWQEEWVSTGVCMNPNAYEVHNVPFSHRGTWTDRKHQHFLFVGYDAFVQIYGTNWKWKIGD